MRTKRKTYHLPPEKNYTHLSPNCRDNNCVFGWLDHFEGDDQYVTTTACSMCRPETYAYLQMFPNVGQRTEQVLIAMQNKRQQLKTKGARNNDF